jgi:EmrB/QacA subfamily drug resistance transporter
MLQVQRDGRVVRTDMKEIMPISDEPRTDAVSEASRWIPLAMASALFMDLLDTSALGTALPTLARQFHTEPLELRFALTAYLMTMAVFVPASGWLADRFGPRRVFVNAVRVYLLGSLCCGLSNSVTTLVAARVLQGLGGAMMTPVARLIVVATTPRERLVRAMNVFTTAAVVGPLLGPPLAGLLLEWANWRWIFFINLPVGVLGIVGVLRIVPRLRSAYPGPFDRMGFVLAATTIVGVVVLAETVGMPGRHGRPQLAIAVAAAIAALLYFWHSRRCDAPVLSLRLLSVPTYRASMFGGALIRLGISAIPFLMPLLFQVAMGWTPVRCGLVTTSLMLGSMLARYGGTWAIKVVGFRKALVGTAMLAGMATMAPVVFNNSTSALLIVATLITGAFLRAAHFVASSALAFADVVPQDVSRASTLATVIQQLSYGFGISLAGLALYLSAHGSNDFTIEDFRAPFAIVGFAALLAIPLYLQLHSEAGSAMRERHEVGGKGV